MLLKSLKLKDFRQFKGEQEITFSTDPVRNVTVIMGENGSGKTTLAQAFTWCLYGDTDFDDKSMLCKATAQSMLPGNEEKVRVELALQHNNIEYLCIREQLYSRIIPVLSEDITRPPSRLLTRTLTVNVSMFPMGKRNYV